MRTLSRNEQYPGVFHAYEKGVTLGELNEAAPVVSKVRQIDFLEPFAAILFQFSALVILAFLAFRSHGSDNSFFWLAMYFGAAVIYACGGPATDGSKWLMDQSGIIAMSIALVGYSTVLSNPFPLEKDYINRIVLYFGSGILAIILVAFFKTDYRWMGADSLDRVIVYASLGYVAFSYFYFLLGKEHSLKGLYYKDPKFWTYPVLSLMQFFYASERYFDGIFHANFFHLPVLTCLVTIIVMLFSIEEHVHQERELAFFGRYIRRGLKQLLGENKSLATTRDKFFRGRKIPIMKIDIVGHTLSTYGMPYGIKREFQDLWFTHIDNVVAGHIFLDKGQGDGSYYYFDESIPGGSCAFVLSSALRVIEHTVKEFDVSFRNAVAARVARFPELSEPVSQFMQRYLKKTGKVFSAHETRVKIALVYGFVDEGLWGLPSQGHYDIEGDLLSLAARLESKASEAEIVMSEEFVEQLLKEGKIPPGYCLNWQCADLKGIGEHRFAVLSKASVENKKEREVA